MVSWALFGPFFPLPSHFETGSDFAMFGHKFLHEEKSQSDFPFPVLKILNKIKPMEMWHNLELFSVICLLDTKATYV